MSSRKCQVVHRSPCLVGAVVALFLLAASTSAQAQNEKLAIPLPTTSLDAGKIKAHWERLTSHKSRLVGSEGEGAARNYIAETLRDLEPDALVLVPFTVVHMKTDLCEATVVDTGKKVPLYPLWPNSARLATTPADGIRGKPIYIGDGSPDIIKPQELRGRIAVLEWNSQDRWQTAASCGAKAVVFLAPAETIWSEGYSKYLRIPANMPRFYLQDSKLINDLRKGRVEELAIESRIRWTATVVHNIYAFFTGADEKLQDDCIVIQSRVDSASAVPDLSPGAQQALAPAVVLEMARQVSARRPARSLLFAFTTGDIFQLRGVRKMMLDLTQNPKTLDASVATQEKAVEDAEKRLKELAEPNVLQNFAIGKVLSSTEAAIAQEAERASSQLAPQLESLRLAAREAPSRELEGQIERVKSHKRIVDGLRTARSRAEAIEDGPEIAENIRRAAEQFAGRWLEQLRIRLAAMQAQRNLSKEIPTIGSTDNWSSTRLLIIGLEISAGNNRWGAFDEGRLYSCPVAIMRRERNLYEYGRRMADLHNKWPEDEFKASYDAEVAAGTRHWSSYMPAPMATSAEVGKTFGVPSFTFSTINDLRAAWDTPFDVRSNVKMSAVIPQAEAMWRLIWQLANDEQSFPSHRLKPCAFQAEGLVVGRSPGRAVPALPIADALVTADPVASQGVTISQPAPRDQIVGTRWLEWASSNEAGQVIFQGLASSSKTQVGYKGGDVTYRFEAFITDPTGAITWASDHGQAATEGFPGTFSPTGAILGTRTVLFQCEGVSVYGFLDSRYLETLAGAALLDAANDIAPRYHGLFADRGAVTILCKPHIRWKLLMSRSGVGIRMILTGATQDNHDGAGFSKEDIAALPPVYLQAARDVITLNDWRIGRLESYGIKNEMLRSGDPKRPGLHEKAEDFLKRAEQANKDGTMADLLRSAGGALANASNAYAAAITTSDDTVKAVIFLLVGLVPFAFCMERLLYGTPNIYKQIVAFSALLFGMGFILYLFHPAFRITTMPMIILLAFIILLLSSIVIFIVYGKFQTEMKKLRGERVMAHTTSLSRSSVIMQAVTLGINNMRKRKTRTGLTLATLSLVTFVLLCFTSVQTYLSRNVYSLGEPTRYPGILVRQQGWQKLPTWTMDYFHSLYPKLSVAGRYWLISTNAEEKILYTISHPGVALASFTGLLGLEPAEGQISDINKALPNWDALAAGKDVCYLPEPLARRIDVKVGQEVQIFGDCLRVAGIFRPHAPKDGQVDGPPALSQIRLLTGEPFTPVDKTAPGPAGGAAAQETVGGRFAMAHYEHMNADQIIIVPAHLARRYGAELYSVAIRAADAEAAKTLADDLAERTTFPVFAGLVDGVKVISATTLAKPTGDKIIAVPLIIGALIILNTMLGSVAERRREINIYTSLGLAPLHVAALFLAEAAAFGIMGTMMGYVLGQGVATFINHTGWVSLPGLNYSSMSAIGTMMLVIGMVLVSSLYPARMAFKEAAPAVERTWKVPAPVNSHIKVELPFTIDAVAARGMCAFLWEWFDEHTEASIGDFATGWVEPLADAAKQTRGLRAQVWIAPFDLGIVQFVTLQIEPTDIENIYRVMMDLERRSGPTGPWHRLNKLFMKEVRKQFLLWRALTPQTVQNYIKQSDELFGEAAAVSADTSPEQNNPDSAK